eukprot:7662559-Lingulodinium_polyedra.AAC.1
MAAGCQPPGSQQPAAGTSQRGCQPRRRGGAVGWGWMGGAGLGLLSLSILRPHGSSDRKTCF